MGTVFQDTSTGVAGCRRVTKRAGEGASLPEHSDHAFANPFHMEDLLIFDAENLRRVLTGEAASMALEHLAWSMYGASPRLVQGCLACLSAAERQRFQQELARPLARAQVEQARHLLLDQLFWELTYWKTPDLYEELIAGEHLHPGIFQQLEPFLQGKVALDVGAGSGRASWELLRHGAKLVYAVEPSPGLLHILHQKLSDTCAAGSIVARAGDFAHVPLPERSVDLALACSAFTADPAHGGERGLVELKRVTRPGGYIIVIWPRPGDRSWLAARGFRYVAFPQDREMCVSFSSWSSALRCVRRFYANNRNVRRYLLNARQPKIPFSVLGINAPCDYCWLPV